ncbi:Imm26 family immunity protein [Capnocytophaga gingivalis]|uniref:Imm26 family immunity protein n=1 Tax=Capnocytophaga gingivalis TaxID=1017 RepID=UPI0028E6EC21|nr:Imm26 family immunity protein [Capnocytophaga gingivalis]
MINDQTLDLVFEFLTSYSQYFQKNLHRKPTIEELQGVLNASFAVNIDEALFSACEEKAISEVKFKIVKRKKQRKYTVGDICAIPLRGGGYAFSRIILLETPMWYLSEVFAYHSEDKAYREEIEQAGYLFAPIFVTPSDYKRWNAVVIHQTPNYKSSFFDTQYYHYGLPNNYRKVKLGQQGDGEPISGEEAERYPKMVFEDQIAKIEEALKGKGLIKG